MSKTAYNISLKGYVVRYAFDRSTVDKELAKNEGKQVNVLIDSLGGSLATGLSISATNQRDGSFGLLLAYVWCAYGMQTKSHYVCSGNVVWGWRWR